MINIIKVKNNDEASDKAFELMKEYLQPGKVLGLATGSTPLGLYARMIRDHEENGTSYLDIDRILINHFIIFSGFFFQIISQTARDVHILFPDIDMIEKIAMHESIIAFR
ncbi:MAG: hypothetical protein IKS69_08430, partial [Erysipelotrichaceae bacterium]|nr:hypothetical protein [Erysipelotrichaceae bacterium]